MDKRHSNDHNLGSEKDLGDKSYARSQSFRALEWSDLSMEQQIRRDRLLSESCRFDSSGAMKSVYKSIENEMIGKYEVEDVDVLRSKHPDVMGKINNEFEQVLALRKENSKKMSEIYNVLSKNKSVDQQALTKWLGNIDVSEEEDGKVLDVILAKTRELLCKPRTFFIRNRGKERNEIIESINTRIKGMNEVLPIYKPFRKIEKFASQYLGNADKEIIENMSSAFSQLLESYKAGSSTTMLIENIKEYGDSLKGLPEAVDIYKKAEEFKRSNNELISLFGKDMDTISKAYRDFRDRHKDKDSSPYLLQLTLQDKWTHLTEELRGKLKQSLEKQRKMISDVFEDFNDNGHLDGLKSLYEGNRENFLDFSCYSFDKDDDHKLDEHVTNIVNFDIHTLQEIIIHVWNNKIREWENLPISDDLKMDRSIIEQEVEEIVVHLAKNEKPDDSVEQLMQLVKSIKEFDEELKASRSESRPGGP
jgi:hypothetical protein